MDLSSLQGTYLGTRVVEYDDRTTILYAICCGASSDDLDLVWERSLRPLPALATVLGLWAVEAAGDLGAYDRTRSLHVGQSLVLRAPLPAAGAIETHARIASTYDKGTSALVEVVVESAELTAIYTIFLPGMGGFGGDRGPSAEITGPVAFESECTIQTPANLAALYRLTGDRHPVHIDPALAQANGFARPVLHGLCTLGIALNATARLVGRHPADLTRFTARMAAPVTPGDAVTVRAAAPSTEGVRFEAAVGDQAVIRGGTAEFAAADGSFPPARDATAVE